MHFPVSWTNIKVNILPVFSQKTAGPSSLRCPNLKFVVWQPGRCSGAPTGLFITNMSCHLAGHPSVPSPTYQPYLLLLPPTPTSFIPLRERFTHDFQCCVSAVLCLLHKHIDHFHLPLHCHLFCPELKIHFHNQSTLPATTSCLSFLRPLTPIFFVFNPFHNSMEGFCQ